MEMQPVNLRAMQIANVNNDTAIVADERALRSRIHGLVPKEQAEEVATQLETMFLNMMLSAMRETVPEGGLFKNEFGGDTYVQMMDQELARLAGEHWQTEMHDPLVRQILANQPHSGPAELPSAAEALKVLRNTNISESNQVTTK